MPAEELVAYVKELQRTNPQAKELWTKHAKEKGGRNFDPNRHTSEFLQDFINIVESGSAASFLGSEGGASPTVNINTGMSADGDLVAKVKELQRTSQNAKEQWMAFTDLQGSSILDPAKHTRESLETFLEHLNSGASFPGQSKLDFAEFIKALQRRFSSFKTAWAIYCKNSGGGLNDPNAHDVGFQASFFDLVTQNFVKSQTGEQAAFGAVAGPPSNEPPKKKARTAPSFGAAASSSKDGLVQAIKDFQKSGAKSKELWTEYCVAYLGGNFDPNRHDETTLAEFCSMCGLPTAGGGGSGLPGGGLGGGGGAAWGTDPANPFTALLKRGVGGLGSGGSLGSTATPKMGSATGGGGNSPEKQALVNRIKVFQKNKKENWEVWSVFCGPTKDPNRHEVDKLQEFCSLNGC